MFIRDFTSKRMLPLLALSLFVACSSNKKTATKENDDAFLSEDVTSTAQEAPASEDISDTSSSGQVGSSDSLEVEGSKESSSGKSSSGAKAATVKTTPFEKDGFFMNAFYFVQSNQEDYSALSNKFYGRPDRAELLKKWNSTKKPKIGNVIYYNSPFRHSDSAQMLSFGEDFGASNGQITSTDGDTLKSIAKKIYGDERAWRILASMNPQIIDPDSIEPGTQLVFQPQVDTAAKLQEFVSNGSGQNAQAANSAQAGQAEQAAQAAQAEQANVDQSKSGDLDLGTSDDGINLQDEIAEGSAEAKIATPKKSKKPMIIGLLVILGAVAFLVIKRRRARA
ncbi:MAG: LysM peptidoglycan-binding domain-containing protein [Proteobacteria bacterium]|nr:LysM peptidoglycan-binding domain-containing protein [Pseudomonadota bacterium]